MSKKLQDEIAALAELFDLGALMASTDPVQFIAMVRVEIADLRKKLIQERQRHKRYLEMIGCALSDIREYRDTGEPALSDAREIQKLIARCRGA